MAAPQHVDREAFLTRLRQSGLLSDEELDVAAATVPQTHRGRLVARALVERGLLTKFQAEMLLAGRTGPFTLGQYRILDQLGQGGMGRVFKAVHQTMNRIVALKVLAPQGIETEKGRQLFRREMQAAARLAHPNIVTAFDASKEADRYYLVMEYVDGPNLDRLVRDHGPLPVGLACDFVRQAALGLQHAHEMGMVHRDIKPSNLLVQRPSGPAGKGSVVKILDFGLARLGEADEAGPIGTIEVRPNTVLGTPDYLSPEQARDLHAVDIRSDLYSLGCTFYYLLTGLVPYPDGSTMEKLVRHGTEEPTPVERLRPEVPAAVAAVVRRLMAKKPAERYQTPAELAAALATFAVAGPTAWRSATADANDLSPTPAPPGSGLDAFDDISALAGTLPPDHAPTALSSARLARVRTGAAPRYRLGLALGVAVVIVVGLLALIGVLSGW